MESDSSTAPTIQQTVTSSVGTERVESVFYHEQRRSLNDPAMVWHEYTSIDALPQTPLDGWEELLVYTDTHVYRWIEMGGAHGPTVLPRDPESVVPTPSFLTDDAQSTTR